MWRVRYGALMLLGSSPPFQVLVDVAGDDNDNPYDVILRNNRHEQKLKDWKKMAPEEK